MSIANAPTPRDDHTAVWTGSQMIVWGGFWIKSGHGLTNTGAIYDVASDKWKPMSTTNAPSRRSGHVAVWTGNRMIVWGGWSGGPDAGTLADGGIYDPITDSWEPLPIEGTPEHRVNANSVWTGNKMLVFGGNTDLRKHGLGVNTGGILSVLP
jgi:hypothetical protein